MKHVCCCCRYRGRRSPGAMVAVACLSTTTAVVAARPEMNDFVSDRLDVCPSRAFDQPPDFFENRQPTHAHTGTHRHT